MPEDVWKALADPTRRLLLDLLREKPRTTGELCDAISSLDRCTVMKHLEVLERSHLVIWERRGRQRVNFLNPAPLQQIVERWVSGHTAKLSKAALALKKRVQEKK